MTNPVARQGDSSTHGGAIVAGSPTVKTDGKATARVGDLLACPIHGSQPIVDGCPIWTVDGKAAARSGSKAACGAVIIGGSTTMKVP